MPPWGLGGGRGPEGIRGREELRREARDPSGLPEAWQEPVPILPHRGRATGSLQRPCHPGPWGEGGAGVMAQATELGTAFWGQLCVTCSPSRVGDRGPGKLRERGREGDNSMERTLGVPLARGQLWALWAWTQPWGRRGRKKPRERTGRLPRTGQPPPHCGQHSTH